MHCALSWFHDFLTKFCENDFFSRGVLGKYTNPTDHSPFLHRPNYFLKLEQYTDLPKYRINTQTTQTILIHSFTKKLESFSSRMLQKGLNFSLYSIDYLLHDSHQERRTFNTSLVLEKIIFYFQHMQMSFLPNS